MKKKNKQFNKPSDFSNSEESLELIRKLERVNFPEIEIRSHKERLKEELLANYSQERKKWQNRYLFKKLAFGSLALVFLTVLSFYLITPKYSLAEVKEIVLADPKIEEFIERGGVLKEIKIVGDEGYVLLLSPPEKEIVFDRISEKGVTGVLVKVDLRKKEIANIEKITPSIYLDGEAKERAEEIIQVNLEKENSFQKKAEILEVKSIPSELRLIKKGKEVKVLPREKKVEVIYRVDERKWEGEVDLIKETVRKVELLNNNKDH